MSAETLIQWTSDWLSERKITSVVVGFSGGVDSATTAALLSKCGVEVCLIVSEAPNQKYSSSFGGLNGASEFSKLYENMWTVEYGFDHQSIDPVFNEAALPIMRLASFYGQAAVINSNPKKKAVVAGTVNFSEAAFLGFFGKSSDMVCDVYPISHLYKSEVYELAEELKVPEEIRNAEPSGDLLFTDTNDWEMIGASYPAIQKIGILSTQDSNDPWFTQNLILEILNVDDPKLFIFNILKNSFKYELSFPGFHICRDLEDFRKYFYPNILKACKEIVESHPELDYN